MYYCYLINSVLHPNNTYIGVTNNLEKRIKQHNNILFGGAKSTKKYNDWKYIKIIKFDTKNDALSFEWFSKHYKTKNNKWIHTPSGIHNKITRMNELMSNYKCEIMCF